MIKKIKKWIATNRKLRDERKEREFKSSLNKEYLMRSMLNALIPQDWGIEIKYYTIGNNNFIEIYNFEALKRFVEEDGIILYKDDGQLYKKVKWLNKHNIKYLITEDKRGIEYNTRELDYEF